MCDCSASRVQPTATGKVVPTAVARGVVARLRHAPCTPGGSAAISNRAFRGATAGLTPREHGTSQLTGMTGSRIEPPAFPRRLAAPGIRKVAILDAHVMFDKAIWRKT